MSQQNDILGMYKEQLPDDLLKNLYRKRERLLKEETPQLINEETEETPIVLFIKRIYNANGNRKYTVFCDYTKSTMEYEYWGLVSDSDGKNAEPINPNHAIFLFYLNEFQKGLRIKWYDGVIHNETV